MRLPKKTGQDVSLYSLALQPSYRNVHNQPLFLWLDLKTVSGSHNTGCQDDGWAESALLWWKDLFVGGWGERELTHKLVWVTAEGATHSLFTSIVYWCSRRNNELIWPCWVTSKMHVLNTWGIDQDSKSNKTDSLKETLKDDVQELVTVCNLQLITGKQGQCCSPPWITVSQIQASAGAALHAEQGEEMDWQWFKMAFGVKFAQFNGWSGEGLGDFPHASAGNLKCLGVFFVAPLLLLIRHFLLSVSPALQNFNILIPGTCSKMQPINCWATPGRDQFAQGYS